MNPSRSFSVGRPDKICGRVSDAGLVLEGSTTWARIARGGAREAGAAASRRRSARLARVPRHRRLVAIAALVAALLAVHPVREAAFPYTNPQGREVMRLYHFAQRQFGDLLDGVSIRFVDELVAADVVDEQGRIRGWKLFESRPSEARVQSLLARVSRSTGIPEHDLSVEIGVLLGAYVPSSREVLLNISEGPSLETAGEEIAHAAIGEPDERVGRDQARRFRTLHEAFAGTLGQFELVAAFMRDEQHLPADEVTRRKETLEAAFWQEAEAEPASELALPSTAAWEPYHHSVVVHGIVDKVVKADLPLRERFVRARRVILLHSGIVEWGVDGTNDVGN
jgi:hypothetical protein